MQRDNTIETRTLVPHLSWRGCHYTYADEPEVVDDVIYVEDELGNLVPETETQGEN